MTSVRIKLTVAAVILASAITYLAAAGIKSGWVYYVDVDKYCSDSSLVNQRVRLHGKVSPDHFQASPGTLTANFTLLGKSQTLTVDYHGSIPDMFQPDREVVIEGRKNPTTGHFQADVLLTKCASKYEAKGAPHAKEE